MKNLKIKAVKNGDVSQIVVSSDDIAITRIQAGDAVQITTRGNIPSLRDAKVMINELAKVLEAEQ